MTKAQNMRVQPGYYIVSFLKLDDKNIAVDSISFYLQEPVEPDKFKERMEHEARGVVLAVSKIA